MSDTPKSTLASRPRRSNRFRLSVWTGVILLVYTLTGFLLLPVIIKSQLLKQLPVLTKRRATVAEVRVNPYNLSLTVRGLALTETNGETFAGFGELYVNFELASIFKGAWTFQEISLKRPVGQVTMLPGGKFNFSNLIDDSPGKPAKATPTVLPAVVVEHLDIEGGAVNFSDLTHVAPFHLKMSPIQVHLTHLTTRRSESSPYSFTASDDAGQSFSWSGDISVDPPASHGILKLGQIDLKRYAPYLADFFAGEISGGKADVSAAYRFALAGSTPDLAITNGVVRLTSFEVKSPEHETVIIIPSMTIEQAEANLAAHSAKVESVKSIAGSILARRNHDGTINLLGLLKRQPARTADTNAPASAVLPSTSIDNASRMAWPGLAMSGGCASVPSWSTSAT